MEGQGALGIRPLVHPATQWWLWSWASMSGRRVSPEVAEGYATVTWIWVPDDWVGLYFGLPLRAVLDNGHIQFRAAAAEG